MLFSTEQKDSTGEILKFAACKYCEQKIKEGLHRPDINFATTGYQENAFAWITHDRNYWTVEKYAREGCPMCRLVLAILQDEDVPSKIKTDGITVHEARIFVEVVDYSVNAPVQVHRIHESSDSPATLMLSKKWVKDCIDNHKKCAITFDHAMPSRLLEIDFSKEKGTYQIRLRTSNISPDIQYTTLSHAWGSLDFVRLVKDNISNFQEAIPASTLTKTFQDALRVTSEFGFRYLWIDSLCIIQDDIDDWRKESSRMASVYGGSSLNIAATGARDGNDGLFFDRNPNLINKVEFMTGDFEERGRPETSELNEDRSKVFVCTDAHMFTRSCLNSPLLQRAWTLQERLLSPRTLHFSRHQIILECYTCTHSETFGEVEDKPFGTMRRLNDLHYELPWYTAWNEVVQLYTTSKLTFSSDKLVALSGVARYFASKYNAEYLSGIWKEHLPYALLWIGEKECRGRHLPLRGPTWSWASVGGAIESLCPSNLHCEDDVWYPGDFKILDILVDTTPSDPFGHCFGGTMRIACVKVLDSDIIIKDSSTRMRSELCLKFDNTSYCKVYLLKISNGFPETHRCGDENGLLITPVAGRKGFFTRIGAYFTISESCPVGDLKILEDARKSLEPLRDDESSLYEGIYGTNEAGKRMYIITLI